MLCICPVGGKWTVQFMLQYKTQPCNQPYPILCQAETLGNLFRNVMYPPSAGGGLLRLHSTYRHDLKIYSSGGSGAARCHAMVWAIRV